MEGQPSYRIPPPWANRNARRPKEKSSLSGKSCRDSPTLKTTTAQAAATDVSTNKRGAATASRLRIAVPEEIAELLIPERGHITFSSRSGGLSVALCG